LVTWTDERVEKEKEREREREKERVRVREREREKEGLPSQQLKPRMEILMSVWNRAIK
jgi:hypothetical protein